VIALQDAPVTFHSGVVVVTVPVVVRDGEGRAVGTLKKEDFELFDKGKRQVISRFTVEKGYQPVAGNRSSGVDGGSKAVPGPPPANRFVAYLFDDLHLPFADLVRARVAAIAHLKDGFSRGTGRRFLRVQERIRSTSRLTARNCAMRLSRSRRNRKSSMALPIAPA
jgi:VWFA-related protein